jgi:hypothetical protein
MDQFSPSEELKHRVLNRIAKYETKKLRFKIVGFSAATAGSLGAIAWGVLAISGDTAQSGFFQFASLFFSNFGAAMANFSDISLSLLESFPAFPVALFLGGIVATAWSTGHLFREVAFARK